MKTPICDFLREYAGRDAVRLHMPGHKGNADRFDITEIPGADSLYSADGIIAESERYAGELFGAKTYYSAEGSSLSIRAMLYLASLDARESGRAPLVLAGRNAHKSFVSGAALLGLDIEWLPHGDESYLSAWVDTAYLDSRLSSGTKPAAVYLTSPDYLGFTVDISAVSEVCKHHGVLLLVDNAHGAYLKFTTPSRHPIDLGADMCADSAHKTLPALTGAAYLHISRTAPKALSQRAREALALFGSTSPSYLILASLDKTNEYLASGFAERLAVFPRRLDLLRDQISSHGYTLVGDEPMKLTIKSKTYGYTGTELSELLSERGIVCDFADPDYVVLMPTPENSESDLDRLLSVLRDIKSREPITNVPPRFSSPRAAISPRCAILSPAEELPTDKCEGRILAALTVGCPPAVPIAVSGEIIDREAIAAFEYYGINRLSVVK